jgi:hypothetical protein
MQQKFITNVRSNSPNKVIDNSAPDVEPLDLMDEKSLDRVADQPFVPRPPSKPASRYDMMWAAMGVDYAEDEADFEEQEEETFAIGNQVVDVEPLDLTDEEGL